MPGAFVPAGSLAGVCWGRSSSLEIRAAGHGDGFRPGGGEQVSKARKQAQCECANYHLEAESGRAPGRSLLSSPIAASGFGKHIEARLALKAQLARFRMVHAAQVNGVAIVERLSFGRQRLVVDKGAIGALVIV